jgi:hypothetical protein
MKNVKKVISKIEDNYNNLTLPEFENVWVELLNNRLFSRVMDEAMIELGHDRFITGNKALREFVINELIK